MDTMAVLEHISLLGFAINWEKSSPFPCLQLVYLGISLDSLTESARLSPLRRDAILSELSQACVGRRVTALSIMRLLGLMAAPHPVDSFGSAFHAQNAEVVWLLVPGSQVSQVQDSHHSPLRVSRHGVLGPKGVTSYVVVFTDTSLMGWGGTHLSHSIGGEWH